VEAAIDRVFHRDDYAGHKKNSINAVVHKFFLVKVRENDED
jgi:hypothetical protein